MSHKEPGLRAMSDLATPMSIRVGATLHIADHIAAGRTDLPSLAQACGAHSEALERLLEHWVWAGLLDSVGQRYSLTDLGQQLRSDHPRSRQHWLDIEGGVGRGDLAFVELLHTVRTGESAYRKRYGRDFWEDLGLDHDLGASFDRSMRTHIHGETHAAVLAYPWHEVTHVVDVGGGTGALLEVLLSEHPHLRGTLVDLPGPAQRARASFAQSALADRVTVTDGSFFEPLPSGADVYILSAILHDWPDKEAITILTRCTEATRHGSRVLVLEACGPDGETVDPRMDLRMLAFTGGRERGEAELTALAEAAGLRLERSRRVMAQPHLAIIDLRPNALALSRQRSSEQIA